MGHPSVRGAVGGVELKPIELDNAAEIEREVSAFARKPNSGLIVVVSASSLRSSRADRKPCGAASIACGLPYRSFVDAAA